MRNDEKECSRKIITPHFGEIEVSTEHIFQFEEGMLGFERLKDFVLISEEETEPFKWLISLDEPEIGFPLISPWYLDLEYKPLKEFSMEKQVIFVVITLQDSNGNMSANMKAPVILNVDTQMAEQIIIPSDKYLTNYIIQTKKK